MDTFWIIVGALMVAFTGLMVRMMVMRRSYRRSGVEFRRRTAGKSYFDVNKSCYVYTRQLLENLGAGRTVAALHIPQKDGEALIEFVLLHATGVYAFEIKDYGGALNGDADGEFWTLTLDSGRTEKLPNPLLQGKAHIRAIEEALGGKGAVPVFLYTVFGQRCKLQAVPEPEGNVTVAVRGNLKAPLQKAFAERPEALSEEQLDAAFKKLKAYSC